MISIPKRRQGAFLWRQRLEDLRLALRETQGDEQLLDIVLGLRFIVLLLLIVRFGLPRAEYSPDQLVAIRALALAGFGYLLILGLLRGWRPHWARSGYGKTFQVLVDSIGAAWILIQTRSPSSELFLIYLFPLYVATSHFRLRWYVLAFAWISITHLFAQTVLYLSITPPVNGLELAAIYLFREGVLFVLSLVFLSERSYRVFYDWTDRRESLLDQLAESGSGVYAADSEYRLVMLSESLRRRLGEPAKDRRCYEFLLGRQEPCPGCALAAVGDAGPNLPQQFQEVRLQSNHGKPYRAILETVATAGPAPASRQAFGIVRDLDHSKRIEEEVQRLLKQVARAHARDRRELRRKEAFVNQELATLFDISRISVTEDVNRQYHRILRGTVELLECQAGTLRLLGMDPQGRESLVLKASICPMERKEDEACYLNLDSRSSVVDAFIARKTVMNPDLQNAGTVKSLQYFENAHALGLRAQLTLPLLVKDAAGGTLTLYRQHPGPFSEAEIRLGESLARFFAAVVVVREEVDRRQEILRAITELSRRIVGISDVTALLNLATEHARQYLHAEIASIFLVQDGLLRHKSNFGVPGFEFAEESYAPGEGITGRVLVWDGNRLAGQPQLDNHVDESHIVNRAHLRTYRDRLPSHRVKHLLAVPLEGQHGAFGVLRVVNKRARDASLSQIGFTPEEKDLLYSLARQIAVAIENVRHLEEANKRVWELGELQRISATMAATLNLDRVMNTLVQLTGKLVTSYYTAVALVKNGDLVFSYENAVDPGILPLYQRARPGGTTRKIIETRKQVYVPVIAAEDEDHNPIMKKLGIRSYLGVPIQVEQTVLGVLFVHSREPNAFDQASPLLQTFANEAAIAIQRAQLFEASEKRVAELTALNNVAFQIAELTDLEQLLNTIVEGARRLIGASNAYIFLYNEQSQRFSYGAASFAPGAERDIVTEPRPAGFTHQVATERRLIRIDDVSDHPLFRDRPEWHLKSIVGLPLERGSHLLGVFTVAYTSLHSFSPDEEQLLNLFARQASIAVDKSRLYEEVKEQRNRLQQYIQEGATRLVQHTDLEGLYSFIVQAGQQFLGAEDCSLSTVDPELCEVHLVASTSLPREVFGQNPTLLSSGPRAGLTSYVAATGEILRLDGDQIFAHPAWSGRFTDHLRFLPSLESKCLLIVPVRRPDGVIVGVLKAENKLNRPGEVFSKFEEEILVSLANQAAISMDRANRIKQMVLHERSQLAGDLHDGMNVIGMAVMAPIETALERLHLPPGDRSATDLEKAWRAARYTYDSLSNILQDLRDRILLERGLGAALRNYAGLMQKDPIQIIIRAQEEELKDAQVEHVLYRIAQEAINNSLKHGELGECGRIVIEVQELEEGIKLTAEDNGVGFRTDAEPETLSLGLRHIQDLARSVNSQAVITSAPGQGTRIEILITKISLPEAP